MEPFLDEERLLRVSERLEGVNFRDKACVTQHSPSYKTELKSDEIIGPDISIKTKFIILFNLLYLGYTIVCTVDEILHLRLRQLCLQIIMRTSHRTCLPEFSCKFLIVALTFVYFAAISHH
ncbi:hypothetical protein T11_18496 [Trichinella zimbabwensis]|uniref:Uncharacterized protein n=1 Tax=Trichinella zimbabwensis TaxID=268475 RepID=A0A0V1HQ34_9BILA|nr:hypothetical protein T11_18496 [Trichinella zimbabwensis]